ncbi:MAG: hypothetical protein JOY80_00100 [Candidatus Dormibacteraeota bacterium]|nr:hypothetical protein [Candidatus Dormibacteraeota bacterium]
MELSFAFFADAAVVPPDGKVYVLGGGFSALQLPQLPARAGFAVVAGFRFGPTDVGQPQQVEVRLIDGDGKLVIPAGNLQFQLQGATLTSGQELSVTTVTPLQPMFAEPGTYTVEFWYQQVRLSGVNLHVVERQPPQPPSPTRPN